MKDDFITFSAVSCRNVESNLRDFRATLHADNIIYSTDNTMYGFFESTNFSSLNFTSFPSFVIRRELTVGAVYPYEEYIDKYSDDDTFQFLKYK